MRSLREKALTLLSYWKVSYKPGLSCTKLGMSGMMVASFCSQTQSPKDGKTCQVG